MNESNKKQEAANPGLMSRLVTVVGQKIFDWLCWSEMGMSPYESQIFTYHCGMGWEEAATYHHIAQTKHYREQI